MTISTSFTLLALPIFCNAYCMSDLHRRDIVGIWRLRSKQSYLPKLKDVVYPMKEFTVFPINKKMAKEEKKDEDILLLLREDGNFVQYGEEASIMKNESENGSLVGNKEAMRGSWGLVDGKLILAADRPNDITNKQSHSKMVDTILAGKVKATSGQGLMENPALMKKKNIDENNKGSLKTKVSSTDIHLKVMGEISVGKFFYPQTHPNFFDQPIFGATPTGSFELQQILGNLNTKTNNEDQLIEKFRKSDIMDKRYFVTSYPLPRRIKKRQRWSIKYNKYVDEKPKSKEEKEREEREMNSPIKIKTFEVELFANNTFSTISGLGDTVLRGKWSIVGEERDQFWMSVWRFGFGRNVSGSTYSEGSHLTHQDDVSYWGKINEVDTSPKEDFIDDDPVDWKGTKIEIDGAVMLGVGLEPCSIARFTMIEITENALDYDDEEEDDDYDDAPNRDTGHFMSDLPLLDDDIGSFE